MSHQEERNRASSSRYRYHRDTDHNSFAPMDANDTLTQYYLQLSDEAVSEQQIRNAASASARRQGRRSGPRMDPGGTRRGASAAVTEAAAAAALHIMSSKTSEATYQGDDELDESTTTHNDSPAQGDVTDGGEEGIGSSAKTELCATQSEVQEQQDALDFVHVHLEHLPSQEDADMPILPTSNPPIQQSPSPPQQPQVGYQRVTDSHFSYYRKFASEGGDVKPDIVSHKGKTKASTATSGQQRQHRQLTESNLVQIESVIPPSPSSGSEGHPTSTKTHSSTGSMSALHSDPDRPQPQLHLSPQNSFQRQQALQGIYYRDEQQHQQYQPGVSQQHPYPHPNLRSAPSRQKEYNPYDITPNNSFQHEYNPYDITPNNSFQQHPALSPKNSFNRQQAIQGNFRTGTPTQAMPHHHDDAGTAPLQPQAPVPANVHAQVQHSDATFIAEEADESLLDGHILQEEDFDFVNMNMTISAEEQSGTGVTGEIASASATGRPPQNTLSATTSGESRNNGVVKDTIEVIATTTMNSQTVSHTESYTGSTRLEQNLQVDPTMTDKSHNPEANAACNATTKEVHFSDVEMQDSEDDRHYGRAVSNTETCTSEGDNSWERKEQKERKEKLLQKQRNKDLKIRMTLLETMQHNTRANFCAIFLLGVALCTLVLLLFAKWITNKQENMVYDEEEDQHFVISNNERLMTIEVLAFALIMVLLLGSLCYLGHATCDSNRSLIRAVKHEDACLANSSARRKHPTYKAPYVEGSPHRRRSSYDESSVQHHDNCCTPFPNSTPKQKSDDVRIDPMAEDQSLTTNTDTYPDFQQNQSLSMLSSGTQSDLGGDNQEEILISMEEADRYYRALEEEEGGVCCSPLPSIHAASTEEQDQDHTESNSPYNRFDDQDFDDGSASVREESDLESSKSRPMGMFA